MLTRSSGFYPSKQPEIYWHDEEWSIDLLPLEAPNGSHRLRTNFIHGSKSDVIELPENYGQIRSILRAPDERAIVIADISGTVMAFCIVDLRLGKVVDQVPIYSPSVSPDRRFIIYVNGFPPHGSYGESQYRLYDTLKTPRENTCGFRDNDPQHEDLDESYRGYQVFPVSSVRAACSGVLPEGEDHQKASDFVWSSDSAKVTFVDAQGGSISFVAVRVPSSSVGFPSTMVYTMAGLDNVCDKECGSRNVRAISWNGDEIRATLAYSPEMGHVTEKDINLPLSKFVTPAQ
jgi:hypothetical protein